MPCAQGLDGEIVGFLRDAGAPPRSLAPRRQLPRGRRAKGVSSTPACSLSPEGAIVAVYRKIHLFDVDLRRPAAARSLPRVGARRAGRGGGRREDALRRARPLGLLRPALPRALPRAGERGARFLAVPARLRASRPAATTGRCCCARARSRTRPSCWRRRSAGATARARASHGRSLIVDPWGLVLAQARRSPRRDRRRLRPRRPGPPARVAAGPRPPAHLDRSAASSRGPAPPQGPPEGSDSDPLGGRPCPRRLPDACAMLRDPQRRLRGHDATRSKARRR